MVLTSQQITCFQIDSLLQEHRVSAVQSIEDQYAIFYQPAVIGWLIYSVQQQTKPEEMWHGIEVNPQQRKITSNITVIRNLIFKAIKEYAADNAKSMKKISPLKLKANDDSQSEEVAEVIRDLKKGYIMTKHSDNTQPKTKFVYLSMNERFLCWKSVDKNDEKRIQISTIRNVVRGADKYIKKVKKIKNIANCIVIIAQQRVLVLQAIDYLQSELFEEDIMRAIKYCRKMRLNYHYLND